MRYVAFGPHRVAIHADVPDLVSGVERTFRGMLCPEHASAEIVGRFDVRCGGSGFELSVDGEPLATHTSGRRMVQALKEAIVRRLLVSRPDLLWLHSGAVACGGTAVLFMGPGRSGKSTLVMNLLTRGWTYLSDDVVPLELMSYRVLPFPVTPARRSTAAGTAALNDDKTEVELLPDVIGREPVTPVAIVFPTYHPTGPTELIPYPPALAAIELLRNCRNRRENPHGAVQHACAIIRTVPAFTLPFTSSDRAVDLVLEHLASETAGSSVRA
jgi:hypothetical protein